MKNKLHLLLLGALASAAVHPLNATLVNGTFDTDLSGWTLFSTPTGVPGSDLAPFPTVIGVNSLAAKFQVGLQSGEVGTANYQGGGIHQDVVLAAGLVNLSLDWAAIDQTGGNKEGGRFELLLDGIVLDSFTVGLIPGGSTIVRGSLSGDALVEAGLHNVRIQVSRNYAPQFGLNQYIDNVVLTESVSGVPEPGTAGMAVGALAAGLLRVVHSRRTTNKRR